MADDSDNERQNARTHANQPYDESLDVPDSEEIASLYSPSRASRAGGRSRGDTPPEAKMSDNSDDEFDTGGQGDNMGRSDRPVPGMYDRQQHASDDDDDDDDDVEFGGNTAAAPPGASQESVEGSDDSEEETDDDDGEESGEDSGEEEGEEKEEGETTTPQGEPQAQQVMQTEALVTPQQQPQTSQEANQIGAPRASHGLPEIQAKQPPANQGGPPSGPGGQQKDKDMYGNDEEEGEDSDSEDDDDDDDDDENGAVEGAYDPYDYEHLAVTPEIKELFQYITRYTPQAIDLDTKMKPFTPDYIPCVGDIDAFLKIPRPDAKPDTLGLSVLDEPCAKQSDPVVLDLQLRAVSKQTNLKPTAVKSIESAEKNPKAIDNWINSITDLHKHKPPPNVHYTKNMPDIDTLMQEWPAEFEELLKEVDLPTADLDCDLPTYVDMICALLDIPIYKSKVESLHVLFTLFSEFKNSQHFRTLASDNQLDNELKDGMGGMPGDPDTLIL